MHRDVIVNNSNSHRKRGGSGQPKSIDRTAQLAERRRVEWWETIFGR